MMNTCFPRFTAVWLSLLALGAAPSRAGPTDIATAPLFTATTSNVKPNVLFTLDDSGSMAWDFMPDDAAFGTHDKDNAVNKDHGFNTVYGRRAAQCNGLGYIPEPPAGTAADADVRRAAYPLPVTAAGTPVADASKAFLSGTVIPAGGVGYVGSGDLTKTQSAHNPRPVTSSTPSPLNVVGTGSVSLTLPSGSTATATSYLAGMVVTVFGSTTSRYDGSRYMIGKVANWDSSNRILTIDVAMAVGSGALSGIHVRDGSPIDNVYYTYTGAQKPSLNFDYSKGSLNADTLFYKECNSAITGTDGKSVFKAHIVTPGSAEAQRYANWYYYYGTRMSAMKSSLTLAFKELGDSFRVGFSTINESTTAPTLEVANFDSAQKERFYAQVNAASPDGGTPLRAALAKSGRYFANKLSKRNDPVADPVQYSCQKNFTILSTDGYWNGNAGTMLDGSSNVGQQDGGATPRPMRDGELSTSKTTKTWTTTETGTRTVVTPRSTVSTVTSRATETVTTPHTETIYRKLFTASISSVARCRSGSGSNCTITVTTSAAHGYTVGDRITISGIGGNSGSDYNGTFTVVTVADASTFTYRLSSRPGSNITLSSATAAAADNSCSMVGQGKLITTRQTYTETATTPTNTKVTTTTPSTSTTVYELTRTTRNTREIVTVNGVEKSDTTKAVVGNPTRGSVVSGPVVETGTPNSDSSSTVGTRTTTNSTAVTATGYPTVGNCSTTAAPKNLDEAGTSTTTSEGPTQIGATGPNTTNGTDLPHTDSYTSSSDGPVTTSTPAANISGGSSNTLADVAMYYYQTDLRDASLGNCTGALGTLVCENNIKPKASDTAKWQHMSTFTLSLGMNGTLQYDPNYETQKSGDYQAITIGDKNWPAPDGEAANIDDLWHAAVNGRGRYFSAGDPGTLAASLRAALNTIDAKDGSASAAATSTLQPVAGDNGAYIAQFTSSDWVGDLRAYEIDPDTGEIATSELDKNGEPVSLHAWSASKQLTTSKLRTISYFKKAATGNAGSLREFTYDNLTADGLNAAFDNACGKTPVLSQCTGLSETAAAPINSGANMVSFLRGQPEPQYRTRVQVLGDIVNSSPVHVGRPGFLYTENGYAAFKTTHADRPPTLYVGANDGMLHAFDATNGEERWAHIPSLVMAKLYQLGDKFYESKHQYFVDATPVVGDIYAGGWKTILVGGLNAGGSGYYALDVTDPDSPVALWEFKHGNMGLSYGNPVITKLRNGTWVVVVSSGYNNSDGGGHLFVLNAATGALLKQISTGEGSAGNPSGLSRINAWVDFDAENLAQRFYGGDLLGNVWRFNIEPLAEANVVKLAQLLVEGTPQPITTQPKLAEISANGGKYAVVYVGTGQYLGKSDVGNSARQSIYAIKDTLSSTGLGDVRAGGTLVEQEVVTTGNLRTVSAANPVDWSSQNGWYVDLTSAGERISVDMQLAFNVLTAAGNVPGATATDCEDVGGGTAWLYQLNIISGKGTSKEIDSMVAGLSTVQLSDGQGVTIVTKTDVSKPTSEAIPTATPGIGDARRSSWRELID